MALSLVVHSVTKWVDRKVHRSESESVGHLAPPLAHYWADHWEYPWAGQMVDRSGFVSVGQKVHQLALPWAHLTVQELADQKVDQRALLWAHLTELASAGHLAPPLVDQMARHSVFEMAGQWADQMAL